MSFGEGRLDVICPVASVKPNGGLDSVKIRTKLAAIITPLQFLESLN